MNKENGKIIVAFLLAGVVLIVFSLVSNVVISTNTDKENAYYIEIAEVSTSDIEVKKVDSNASNDIDIPVEAPSFAALLADANIAKGKKLSRACAACHGFDKDSKAKIGPSLWGVVGGDVADFDGFSYSKAMKEKGGKWGYDELDAFLKKPKDAIKGTKMIFVGIKKMEDRASLIAWLRTLSDKPIPLP